MKRDSFARERVTALPADAASVQLSWRVGRAEASTLQVVYIAFKMPVYSVRFIDVKWREKKRESVVPGNVPRPQFYRLCLVYRAEIRAG